jgi:hypothetical protein
MDWTRLEVSGRVTAVQRGICAGVTAEGTVFTAQLRLPHLRPTTYDDVLVDSFGVLGVAPGDETWLTGRGADGRLHLWAASGEGDRTDPSTVTGHSLHAVDAMWAAPSLDAGTELLLSCHLVDGAWRLRTFDRQSAISGGEPKVRDLPVAGSPDTALVVGCPEKEPLVVAGRLGESGSASAWALGEGDWRRVHLAAAPTALTSVAYAWGGRHTWIGGVADGRAVVYELLPLPFRGPLRTAPVPMPALELVALPEGHGRPLIVVDDVVGDVPVVVAAMSRGNRLCWHDGTEWKALPAPDGPLRGACVSGGAVHVLVGCAVWSIEDPTSA